MNTIAIPKNKNLSMSVRIANKHAFGFILRTGIAVIVILGSIYILLINSLATRGFELEALKNERITIQKELEKSDIAAIIPTSLYALRSSEVVQEMDTVKGQKFLRVMEGQVAFK